MLQTLAVHMSNGNHQFLFNEYFFKDFFYVYYNKLSLDLWGKKKTKQPKSDVFSAGKETLREERMCQLIFV